MDKQQQQEFKAILETRREEILKQLESIGSRGGDSSQGPEFPEYGDALEDNAAEVADYANTVSMERDMAENLSDVDAALKKIEDGTYGICNYCGQPIEIERLKARPESTSCVKCKNALKNS